MIKNQVPEEDRNRVSIVTKKAGQLWSSLTEADKCEWNEKAEINKVKYKE